jgi:hypothetical protein
MAYTLASIVPNTDKKCKTSKNTLLQFDKVQLDCFSVKLCVNYGTYVAKSIHNFRTGNLVQQERCLDH